MSRVRGHTVWRSQTVSPSPEAATFASECPRRKAALSPELFALSSALLASVGASVLLCGSFSVRLEVGDLRHCAMGLPCRTCNARGRRGLCCGLGCCSKWATQNSPLEPTTSFRTHVPILDEADPVAWDSMWRAKRGPSVHLNVSVDVIQHLMH